MDASCRKDFYNRAGEYYLESVGGTVTHMFAAEEVGRQYGIVIAACDRHTVQQSVRNRVLANKKMADLIGNTGEVALVAEPPDLQFVDDSAIRS